jgi:hypothetical protein
MEIEPTKHDNFEEIYNTLVMCNIGLFKEIITL